MTTTTGQLVDGTLVLRRELTAPIEDVWASITDSDRLSRWFGTWTGDPREGHVMVTMTAEAEPVPPSRYDIVECTPPRRLSVRAVDEYGSWALVVDLSEDAGRTTLELTQQEIDLSSLAEVGPGWEWYLDRLTAAVEGAEPPGLDAFDTDYMPLSEHYGAMAPR